VAEPSMIGIQRKRLSRRWRRLEHDGCASEGHYEYRFIVDGQWMADPNAAQAVPNPFGSSNSVLNI